MAEKQYDRSTQDSRQHRQSRARQRLHQRPTPGDALLHQRSRPHARSLSQYQPRPTCGSMSGDEANSTCRPGSRTCCAAVHRTGGAGPRRVARAPDTAVQAAARKRSSTSAKATIASKPLAHGVIASTLHAPDESPLRPGSCLACPTSSSTSVPARRSASPVSIGEVMGARSRPWFRERGRPQGLRASGRETVLVIPRDRRAGEAV